MTNQTISTVAGINPLTAATGDELIPLAQKSGANYTKGTISLDELLNCFISLPDGSLLNGKIAVTVASNNLTLALKTRAGNDPSATESAWVKLNGTWRKISSALSVTINAGANSFNAGSAELATKEINYFAYLSWRVASNTVVIGASRIPYATLYSDFSSTATDEKYGAFSATLVSAADCVVIGRFAATLSAGAGYTWSVPTYTSANLIQRPIDTTSWLDWTPALSASGSLTWTTPVITRARYRLVGRKMEFQLTVSATLGGSASTLLYFTVPFQNANVNSCGFANTEGVTSKAIYAVAGTPNKLAVGKYDNSNYATSGSCAVNGFGFYEI